MLGATGQQQQHQQLLKQQHQDDLKMSNNQQSQQQQQQQLQQRSSFSNLSQQPHHHHQHLVNHRTSNANQKPSADDDYLEDHGMRIGLNYQAEIPQLIAYAPAPSYYEDEKAIRVWSPYNRIPDHILDEFINKAKDKFFYNTEQALGMLSWHKFDLSKAYADLPNFVPYPNEWSVEDKVLFEQAYQFHEKQFSKIKAMLPDKSMASLINYYYGWKKTRTRASLMERQTRRFAAKKTDSNENSDADGSENENAESNSKDKATSEADQPDEEEEQADESDDKSGDCKKACCQTDEPRVCCCMCDGEMRNHSKNHNCIIIDNVFNDYCEECYFKYRQSGKKVESAVELGDCFYSPTADSENRMILFTYSDVSALVDGTPEQGDIMLKYLDTQVQDKRREIQTKKQTLSQITEKIQPIAEQISDLNMDEFSDILPEYNTNRTWTPEEELLAVQGFRRYGADFSAISDVIRTKSPETIKLFYVAQKERLGLERLVQDFEKTKESSSLPASVLALQQSQQATTKAQAGGV